MDLAGLAITATEPSPAHQEALATIAQLEAKNAKWKAHHATTKAQLRELESRADHVSALEAQVAQQQQQLQCYQMLMATRITTAPDSQDGDTKLRCKMVQRDQGKVVEFDLAMVRAM